MTERCIANEAPSRACPTELPPVLKLNYFLLAKHNKKLLRGLAKSWHQSSLKEAALEESTGGKGVDRLIRIEGLSAFSLTQCARP